MLTGIIAQVCLHPLIRYESTIFDVIHEAQCFDILLKSTRYVLSIAPEAGPNKFTGDAPQHDMNFGQLLLRLGCSAERKSTVVV
jgi:hypothetical protein